MDLFINAYHNIYATFWIEDPDLIDFFICAYDNIQISSNYLIVETLNMNIDASQDNVQHLPVRITPRHRFFLHQKSYSLL